MKTTQIKKQMQGMGTHVHTALGFSDFFFLAFSQSCMALFYQIIILATVEDNNDSAIAS